MEIRDRQRLKLQLEQQANVIAEENNNAALVVSVVNSCIALLKAAEKSMPETFSEQDFETMYAGYLGIANRVQNFYQANGQQWNQANSSLVQNLLLQLDKEQNLRAALESQIKQVKKDLEEEKGKVKAAEDTLAADVEEKRNLIQKKQSLNEEIVKCEQEKQKLKEELETMRGRIQNFEADIQRLTDEVTEAKGIYREMIAYYEEAERIQKGIEEEGFVDMESFTDAVREMNENGTTLMNSYDRFLKKVLSDVESLRKKIDERRKK